MPILSSSAVLSASFSTGDVPTAQDFENLILSFAIYDGTLPVISGSIIGTGSFGQLKVVNVGTNLTPYSNDKVDLGSTSVRWKNSYFSTASISLLSGSLIPHSSGTYHGSASCDCILDVTNTTNCKVKFVVDNAASQSTKGNTGNNSTYFVFIRLGDT